MALINKNLYSYISMSLFFKIQKEANLRIHAHTMKMLIIINDDWHYQNGTPCFKIRGNPGTILTSTTVPGNRSASRAWVLFEYSFIRCSLKGCVKTVRYPWGWMGSGKVWKYPPRWLPGNAGEPCCYAMPLTIYSLVL